MRWYAVHTAFGAEQRVALALAELPVGEVFLPKSPDNNDPAAWLFRNYLFLRTELTDPLHRDILRLEPVRCLVGTRPGSPSPIPEWEVRLLKYLVRLPRHPRLGVAPQAGHAVEIVDGPLREVRGTVVSVRNSRARVAVSLSLLGQAVEIVVPVSSLVNLSASRVISLPGLVDHKPRHRGGRRMKRHLRNTAARLAGRAAAPPGTP